MKADYDYDQLFPGRFMKSGEFNGREWTFTIKDIDLEEMEDRKGLKVKCIVSFNETKKQLVANRTNAECFKGMWGRKVSNWIGKRVTFYPATVEAFGAPTLAIRVRGSPDLERDMVITCRAGRSGDVQVTMKKTVVRSKAAAAAAKPRPTPAAKPAAPAPTPPPPEPEQHHEEPPDDVALPTKDGRRVTALPPKAAKRLLLEDKSTTPDNVDPVTGEVPFDDDDAFSADDLPS
jgi:hypothetical protein